MSQQKYVRLDAERLGTSSENLRDHLKMSVIGQPEACESLVGALTPYFAGLNSTGRPLATLMFLGPTGIGKSLAAEEMGRHLCGTPDAVTRVACETLTERHGLYSLIGSPPGYVGWGDEVAALSQKKLNGWRKKRVDYDSERINITKPHLSILLFDEIDKATPALYSLLLGILETGKLTLSNSDVTDFSQTIIILTANYGGKEISRVNSGDTMGFGTGTQKDVSNIALAAMGKDFTPELLNRIDKTVVFKSLDDDAIEQICILEIGKVQKRVRESEMGFLFVASKRAIRQLCVEGTSPKFGARELRRVIDQRITQKLANLMASGQIPPSGGIVKVDYLRGKFAFLLRTVILPVVKEDEIKLCDAWGYVPDSNGTMPISTHVWNEEKDRPEPVLPPNDPNEPLFV
jgi:ATP-dependent Clp protease ATP-binding subunit ClpB